MTNYALRWRYVPELPMEPIENLSRRCPDVMCEHLMMRSFSLNENFALLAKQKDKAEAKKS